MKVAGVEASLITLSQVHNTSLSASFSASNGHVSSLEHTLSLSASFNPSSEHVFAKSLMESESISSYKPGWGGPTPLVCTSTQKRMTLRTTREAVLQVVDSFCFCRHFDHACLVLLIFYGPVLQH